MNKTSEKILNRAVVVGALGCFVDSYDLVLFSMLRIPSLESLGLAGDSLIDVGIRLLNFQMLGMLMGGILWGVLGDRRGRVSVLFGSIFLYSLANFANAFVTDIGVYGFLRWLAGLGLAGELGAAVTLIGEQMSAKNRGYGTMWVAFMGALGGLAAALASSYWTWRVGYAVGGGLGFALLAARFGVHESQLFERSAAMRRMRPRFWSLILSRQFLQKYIACVWMGLPIWFVVGIMITFSPEIHRASKGEVWFTVAQALFFAQIGAFTGDVVCGVLSQWLKSRKKALFGFLCLSAFFCAVQMGWGNLLEPHWAYFLFLLLGFSNGYWAVLITMVAESFGTNLRATVATSVPNWIRGSSILLTLGLQFLRPSWGMTISVVAVGVVCFSLAFLGLFGLRETYGKDLDYVEA